MPDEPDQAPRPARCVISAQVVDTRDMMLHASCAVHCCHIDPGDTECPGQGRPAFPLPVHGWLDGRHSRAEHVALWEHTTGRQRTLVIHYGNVHAPADNGATAVCHCHPEVIRPDADI